MVVRYTGRPLTQSDYTRCCINMVVFLRMSTGLLETCRGSKKHCASSWLPTRIVRNKLRCGKKTMISVHHDICSQLYLFTMISVQNDICSHPNFFRLPRKYLSWHSRDQLFMCYISCWVTTFAFTNIDKLNSLLLLIFGRCNTCKK